MRDVELRLPDAFQLPESDPERRVQVLNINKGFNEGLKDACRMLKEYMLYVDNVRNYTKDMPIEEAVDNSIAQVWQHIKKYSCNILIFIVVYKHTHIWELLIFLIFLITFVRSKDSLI